MKIPLFPLHTVLAPGLALPLHVFEERYRIMVRRCLDTSAPFGVVLIREGSEVAPADGSAQDLAIAGIGTFAEIREASRHADGRWDLLAVGTGRFTIREVHADLEPYLLGEVDVLEDDPGDADEAESLVPLVARRFVEYLSLLEPRDGEQADPIDIRVEVDVPATADAEPRSSAAGRARDEDADAGDAVSLVDGLPVPDDPSQLSFLLTGIIQVEPDRKQELLEAESPDVRLRALDELLDREIGLLRARLAPYTPDRRATGRAN